MLTVSCWTVNVRSCAVILFLDLTRTSLGGQERNKPNRGEQVHSCNQGKCGRTFFLHCLTRAISSQSHWNT